MSSEPISRSAQKRQAKQVEELAVELVNLPPGQLTALPCDPALRREIGGAKSLKGGARKRQIKFLAKQLRQQDLAPLLAFLEEKRGSRLREKTAFHELELLREAVLDEALAAQQEAQEQDERLGSNWRSEAVSRAAARFPHLDEKAVHHAARQFALTRKPVHRRELFRLLKAAMEHEHFTTARKAQE